jgi:serine/threonine protein kinase
MGVVLRAYDTLLERPVALKMLLSDAAGTPSHCGRLASEARSASALCHPGIAAVYDFVEQDGNGFIVYELVEGRTLSAQLASGRFTDEEVLDVGGQLADALAAAHQHGIIHRDVKPSNIMLVPLDDGHFRVKILDFGLAKHIRQRALAGGAGYSGDTVSLWTPGLLVGTIAYMAPEQLEDQGPDARTDIYALGLVLYEMAAGANPFLGKTPSSTIANILKQPAPDLREYDAAFPAELDRILLKCLRKDPTERYQSARELLTDLRNFNNDSARFSSASKRGANDASLFGRMFAFVGSSPYRLWEITHIRILIWCVLLAYCGWRFSVATPGAWGLTLFFLQLLCTTTLGTLIGVLLYTGAYDRTNLARSTRMLAPWIRGLGISSGLMAWAMAVALAASHTDLAVILALMGTVIAVTMLTFKPAVDRALRSNSS